MKKVVNEKSCMIKLLLLICDHVNSNGVNLFFIRRNKTRMEVKKENKGLMTKKLNILAGAGKLDSILSALL